MRIFVIAIAIWMANFELVAQQENPSQSGNAVVDSVICSNWNGSELIPTVREKTLKSGLRGEVLEKQVDEWNGTAYERKSQVISAFTNDLELASTTNQVWNGTEYVNDNRTVFQRNAAGLSDVVFHQKWSGVAWANDKREIYEYDNPAGFTKFVFQNWDETSMSWVNQFQQFRNFNPIGEVASTLFQLWSLDESNWVNANRSFETYDADGNHKETKREIWVADAEDWASSSRVRRTFEASNPESVTNDLWDNQSETWIPTTQNLYTYKGDLIQNDVSQRYEEEAWVNVSRTVYEYNDDENLTLLKAEFWENEDWTLRSQCDFFYTSLVGIVEFENLLDCKIANPHRAGDLLNCDGLDEFRTVQSLVFDQVGRVVFSKKGKNLAMAHQLPKGVYTYVILADGAMVFRKKLVFVQ